MYQRAVEAAISARRKAFERCAATCPCCGYPTLSSRAQYELCDICGWQDDGDDEFDDALAQARMHFARYGQMYGPEDAGAFKRMNETADPRRAMAALFDSLLPDVEPERFDALRPEISALSERIRGG